MRQLQLRILGTEVFSMILFSGDADVVEEYDEVDDPEGITGGSAQNFERDYDTDEDFGFRA
jgi:hypothetical protein